MSPQREKRLLDVLATVEEAGHIDREILDGAIQRRWGVSHATARNYIEDLFRRGSLISRFGILSLRFGAYNENPIVAHVDRKLEEMER